MNQKSSLREDLKFVSWMLTGNKRLLVPEQGNPAQART
jgi:hypothetical protein